MMYDATKTAMNTNFQPVAKQGAGSWLQMGNEGLNAALGIWQQVETIKATRDSSGQAIQQRNLQPEVPSGQTVKVDASKNLQVDQPKGPPTEKYILWGSVGVLTLALILKVAKDFK